MILGDEVCHHDAGWASEIDVLPFTARDHPPGRRRLAVLGFERAPAFVAAVAGLISTTIMPSQCTARLASGTSANDARIVISSVVAEWTPFGASRDVGVLRGLCAGLAAQVGAAAADVTAAVDDRAGHGEDAVAAAGEGEGVREGRSSCCRLVVEGGGRELQQRCDDPRGEGVSRRLVGTRMVCHTPRPIRLPPIALSEAQMCPLLAASYHCVFAREAKFVTA